MIFTTHFYCVVKNLFYLYVWSKVLVLVVVCPHLQDAVYPQCCYLHWLNYRPHSLIQILHAVIHLILLTYLQTILYWKIRVLLKCINQVIRFVLSHQLHKSKDRLLWQLILHLSPFIIIDDALEIVQLQKLVIPQSPNKFLLNFRHIILHQHLSLRRIKLNHILDFLFNTISQNNLFILPLLQNQSLKRILQKLKQQLLSWFLRSDVYINTIRKMALKKTYLSL